MEKQLKDLCIRVGQGENLEACLNGYTKPQDQTDTRCLREEGGFLCEKAGADRCGGGSGQRKCHRMARKRGERGGQDDSEGDIRSAGAYF